MSLEYANEASKEKLATDRWENEGGHTELCRHRERHFPGLIARPGSVGAPRLQCNGIAIAAVPEFKKSAAAEIADAVNQISRED